MLACQCDADTDEDFSFLQPMDLITKDVHELRKMINERRKKQQKDRNKESEKEHEGERRRVREKERREREKECEKDREKVEIHKDQEQQHENQTGKEMGTDQVDKVTVKQEENRAFGGNHLFNGIGLHCLISKLSLLHVLMFSISCGIAVLFLYVNLT